MWIRTPAQATAAALGVLPRAGQLWAPPDASHQPEFRVNAPGQARSPCLALLSPSLPKTPSFRLAPTKRGATPVVYAPAAWGVVGGVAWPVAIPARLGIHSGRGWRGRHPHGAGAPRGGGLWDFRYGKARPVWTAHSPTAPFSVSAHPMGKERFGCGTLPLGRSRSTSHGKGRFATSGKAFRAAGVSP